MNRASRLDPIWRTAYLWGPLALVVALAAPSIHYMLPSYVCHLGESYQPLRALRFFQSFGSDYHKYGPVPNFLLAPGYALSIGYWWATGTFSHPSGDFPYGLKQPLEQLSFLILQGRVLFLGVFVALFAFLLVSLRAITSSRVAIALAFLFCVATNYSAVSFAAFTRPDGPMLALFGASLGVYARILASGLTLRRGIALSLLAVLAISTKEIAGPAYVLTYLGLGFVIARELRKDPSRRAELVRVAAWTLATGVIAYALINIVYAPSTWLLRMHHWLAGSGADSAVWGGLGSGSMTEAGFAELLSATLLNNLGPGGSVVVAAMVLAWPWLRPRHGLLLLLPFVSVVGLGLIPLGYASDHFTSVAAVALVLPLAASLGELFARAHRRGQRQALGAALTLALLVNLVFANFAWIRLDGLTQHVVEQALADDPPGSATISQAEVYPEVPGKSRLTWLGYSVDTRSLQQIIDSEPSTRPDRIYLSSGMRGFIDEAKSQPARAAMLREEGLDVASFGDFDSLGYELIRTAETTTPAWFPFDWMPAVHLWRGLSPVYVYRKRTGG